MSDTKFTPGPWVAAMESGFGDPAPYMQVYPVDRMMFGYKSSVSIAMMFCMEMVEQQANAHLIAAAPAMYAMLEKAAKAMWASAANMNAEAAEIEELLAKARGES